MIKKLWLVAMVLALSISVVYAAYPTVTIDLPATSTTKAGSVNINYTLAIPTEAVDNTTLHNCSWYIYSSSTANSSSTLAWATNTTMNISGTARVENKPLVVNTFEDSSDYSFKVTCMAANNSARTASDTNTLVTLDSSVPTAAILSPVTNTKDTDGDVTFSGTITGRNTTGCTLYFVGANPGATTYSMTHSGNTCTKSLTDVPNGIYDWYVKASDGTNTTNAGRVTLQVDVSKTSAGGRYYAATAGTTDDDTGDDTGGTPGQSSGGVNTTQLVVLLVVIVGGYYLMKKK